VHLVNIQNEFHDPGKPTPNNFSRDQENREKRKLPARRGGKEDYRLNKLPRHEVSPDDIAKARFVSGTHNGLN
jgi:hypothetical protein